MLKQIELRNVLWMLLLAFATGSLADETASPAPPAEPAAPARVPTNDLTPELIQSRIKQLEDSKEVAEEVKTQALEYWRKTLSEIQAAEQLQARVDKYTKARMDAPEELQRLKDALAQALPDPASEIGLQTSIAEIEQLLSRTQQELSEAQKQFDLAEKRPKYRADRRVEIGKLIATAKESLASLGTQQELNLPPEVLTAYSEYQRARFRFLNKEIEALEQELLSFDVQSELMPLQKDQAARTLSYAQKKLKFLQDELLQRRRKQAELQAREARKAAADAHPALQLLALKNSELAAMSTGQEGVLHEIELATRYLEDLKSELDAVTKNFQGIQETTKAAGMTHVVGLRLRRQRAVLPNVDHHYRMIRERREKANRAQLILLELEDQRATLFDIAQRTEEMIETLDPPPLPEEEEFIQSKITELLEKQKQYLQALIDNYSGNGGYLELLSTLDDVERELIAQTEEFQSFIDENVLWIQSAAPLGMAELDHLYDAWNWFYDADRWLEAIFAATDNEYLPQWLLACFPVIIFLSLTARRRLRHQLCKIGERAAKGTADTYLPTLEAGLLTVLLALPGPLLVWYCGWLLMSARQVTEFSRAAGWGLQAVAVLYLASEFLRHTCRPNGLAVAHFGWAVGPVPEIRRRLRWLLLAGLPAVFLVTLTELQSVELYKSSLGRLAFIFGLMVFSAGLAWLLHPEGRIFSPVLAQCPEKVRVSSKFWYPLVVLAPWSLIVLTAMGYHYTALQLTWRLKETFWVCLALLFARALLLRWLLVARRRLAMRRWRERRAQQLAAQSDAASPPSASPAVTTEQPDLDLATVHDQTQKLLTIAINVALLAGLWVVWADVLPALNILNRVELWNIQTILPDPGGSESAPNGSQPAPTPKEEVVTITLVNLLAAIGITALAVLASKNLPGFLEISLLQRLPLDNGSRYAITTICRYLISVLGIIFGCSQVGIQWDRVQWLLAAMSVGLGFGLQEIFANVVSGLIILFERPVRVGDIVTIGEITGTVARIRMRATTLIEWDRKEYVVPNKEFITGKLLNWTLSDQINRIVINVGVAFGSDTARVRELLLEIARSHPLIMTDPAPVATFEGFGENSLKFVLRSYLPNLENRLEVITNLHMAIDKRFREEGIEIALPRRDIQIRSAHPLFGSLSAASESELMDNTQENAA